MRVTEMMKTTRPYLTDGGVETFLVFEKAQDLPCFSTHAMVETETGRTMLKNYLQPFLDIATKQKRGFILGTESWRLNNGWAKALGLSDEQLIEQNKVSIAHAKKVRDTHETTDTPIIINGIIGPAGDGYQIKEILSPEESYKLHEPQITTFAKEDVDMATAMTLTHASEAIGIVNAAKENNLPIVISFTVETDGHLPSGQSLKGAIEEVDAATSSYPLFYMINCAHPDHFYSAIANNEEWTTRIGGIRANASRLSHEELDNSESLDTGNPEELGEQYSELVKLLPNVVVVGGCCGTDHRHITCIANKV